MFTREVYFFIIFIKMNIIDEFDKIIDYIYGVYLDSTTGFSKLKKWFENSQQVSLKMMKNTHPELASIDYLDSTYMIELNFLFYVLF